MKQKMNLNDATFLIPIRIETIERLENLKASTDYLLKYFDTHIFILEASARNSGFLKKCLSSKIDLEFIKDNQVIFHRTRYLNMLTAKAETPLIAIWDSDIIVRCEQIIMAIRNLREGRVDFIFPYHGLFLDTGFPIRNDFLKSSDITFLERNFKKMSAPYGFTACGGGFFANKKVYCKAGKENENFYGWGPEDGERVKRWQILGMRAARVKGPMFHLSHPRGINSGFRSKEDSKKGLREYLRICRMTTNELENEIASWPHITARSNDTN